MVVFVGCSSKVQEQNDLLLKEVNSSLVVATENIGYVNIQIVKALEKKMDDPQTFEFAKIWLPKAERIHDFSEKIYIEIEEVKNDFQKQPAKAYEILQEKNRGNELYKMIKQYKDSVLNVDSSIHKEFSYCNLITTKAFDSIPDREKDFAKYFFKNTTSVQALATLNKFQSDIKVFEHQLLSFCLKKTGWTSCGYWVPKIIIYSTTKSIRPNEMIDVHVSVDDDYIKVGSPMVSIDRKPTKVDYDLFAVRTIRASEKIGKHHLPISITYKDYKTGKIETVVKDFVYSVDSLPTKQ